MLFLLAFAIAAEPGSLPGVYAPAPQLDVDLLVPWSTVGFSPAAPESVAFGPDHLALGPDGRWALWDPVRHVILVDGEAWPRASGAPAVLARVDGLAFASNGDLVILDASARILTRWDGTSRWTLPMDRLCPKDVRLVIDGELAAGIDAFGNVRPLADLSAGLNPAEGPKLLAPEYVARVSNGVVEIDSPGAQQTVIDAPADSLAARIVGDWVLVEAGQPGKLRERVLISLETGRSVGLPLDGRYRPASGVTAGPDGTVGFLNPAADGLHIVRVSP